jgi:RNA polymerase sigma factor for flagellar operon FliA
MALTLGYSPQAVPALNSSEREQLILEHLPQVYFIASRIHERLPKHIQLDDLVSAGVLGLISAVDNFDGSRNVKLRTYAEHKIRGYILNSIGKLSGSPRHLAKLRRDIQQAIAESEQRCGGVSTAEDIAVALGVSLDEYHAMLTELQSTTMGTLETVDSENPDNSALRYVADSNSPTPERLFESSQLRSLVIASVDKLPESERLVLSFYYLEGLNLREIAGILDLHISRISQIKTQAILRMRMHIETLWPGRVDLP